MLLPLPVVASALIRHLLRFLSWAPTLCPVGYHMARTLVGVIDVGSLSLTSAVVCGSSTIGLPSGN